MERPIKMDDDWGYPNCRKPPYCPLNVPSMSLNLRCVALHLLHALMKESCCMNVAFTSSPINLAFGGFHGHGGTPKLMV